MSQPITPIPCRPWTLNGLSERLMVSHYENNYGSAVRTLNAIRERLGKIDFALAPAHEIRSAKQEELDAAGSVAFHELYFGNLGLGSSGFTGDGPIPDLVAAALQEQFGGFRTWRREFVGLAQALGGRSGWILLSYSRRDGGLHNHIAFDNSQAMLEEVPILALDMYEHAYSLDFGANATAYVDAFIRNIDWAAVNKRLEEAKGSPADSEGNSETAAELPSMTVEELAARLDRGERVQVLDTRPTHYFSRVTDMMAGAVWRDPERIDEWCSDLSANAPVAVYCAYGFHVGCKVTAALRERGFDARYIKGGLSAWYGIGGARVLKPADTAGETGPQTQASVVTASQRLDRQESPSGDLKARNALTSFGSAAHLPREGGEP